MESSRWEELRRLLAEALSSEVMMGVYSPDLVGEEEIRRVIDESTLRGIVGVRTLLGRGGRVVVAYFREEVCARGCEQRCGTRASECFGRCFYECRKSYREILREKLLEPLGERGGGMG